MISEESRLEQIANPADGISLLAEGLFAKWVDRLRLADWEISWVVCRKSALPDDKTGLCQTIVPKKIAKIFVLHPNDADPAWLSRYDFELTIVHELMHLHLAPWQLLYEDGDQSEILLEQAVHLIARTLVDADRRIGSWVSR